jgi:hypothetical protein
METRGRYRFYTDLITIVKGRRGVWWARGKLIPQLPVHVNIAALRASGHADLPIGQSIGAEVVWGPSGASAYHLWRCSQDGSTPERFEGIDRIMRQLHQRHASLR